MDMLDLDRLIATPVATDPFRHIVVPHFVRPDPLAAVLRAIPPIGARGSVPVEALRLGTAARDLMDAMAGPALRAAIAAKFDLDVQDAPVMVTMRGQTGARDGQIHCDSATKRVTILLYLNPADAAWERQEGCLRLLRGPDDLENFAVEVPPVDGTLLVFPNGPDTWHGHKTFIGKRITVQMNYMTNDAHAKYEMRRHRVSAFFKRLRRAA